MAFNIHGINYYGSGAGNLVVANANTVINSYAQVTAVQGKVLTVGNVSNPDSFVVGNLIFMHVSWYDGRSDYLGKWRVSRLTAINGTQITLYSDCSGILGGDSNCKVQIVTLPEYKNVTLNPGTSLTCPQFNESLGYGGIVAFKCADTLTFNGGHINLNGKGLPRVGMRTAFLYEGKSNMYAAENYDAQLRLAMNYPDGVAFLVANKFVGQEDSRIGNPSSSGVARTPILQTADLGGASILIVAKTMTDFKPAMISKLPSAAGGLGKGRCYIATESIIPCDEGLYAYDRISDSTRVASAFKVRSFGDSSDGTKTDYTSQLNNYAKITSMDSTRKVFTVENRSSTGLAKFKVGALVMIHIGAKDYYALQGRFNLARILDISLNKITVDTAFLEGTGFNPDKYFMQMITIPQFENFTLSKTNSATPKWEDGLGGVCALAVNGTCDLSDGALDVVGKGGAVSGGATMLNKYISNAQMAERLPIGEGNGSVFILANNLTMNTSTRLGGTWDGSVFGGNSSATASDAAWNDFNSTADKLYNGSGKQGGTYSATHDGVKFDLSGGFNSNGLFNYGANKHISGCQGAHLLIIANKITNLNLNALSTGGQGATQFTRTSDYTWTPGRHGGCGFGGGSGVFIGGSKNQTMKGGSGGWLGGGAGQYFVSGDSDCYCGGGGSAGFAFIYCNTGVSQKTTNLLK